MLYLKKGIEALLMNNKNGSRPFVFTKEELALIEKKLKDTKNEPRGYVVLLDWIENEF